MIDCIRNTCKLGCACPVTHVWKLMRHSFFSLWMKLSWPNEVSFLYDNEVPINSTFQSKLHNSTNLKTKGGGQGHIFQMRLQCIEEYFPANFWSWCCILRQSRKSINTTLLIKEAKQHTKRERNEEKERRIEGEKELPIPAWYRHVMMSRPFLTFCVAQQKLARWTALSLQAVREFTSAPASKQ